MDDYFSDYTAYSEGNIVKIDKSGILFCDGFKVTFEDCQRNYALQNKADITSCIGERDITDCSFMFYSAQHPVMVKFLKRNFLREFFGKSIQQRFHELEQAIRKYGYTTSDLS